MQRLDVPLHLGEPPVQARLVRGDDKLPIDTADRFPLGDHQPRQICGKMAAGRFGVTHITKDSQRFLHQGRKVHDGWHGGSLLMALQALSRQRVALHYTPSSLLCKTSVIRIVSPSKSNGTIKTRSLIEI